MGKSHVHGGHSTTPLFPPNKATTENDSAHSTPLRKCTDGELDTEPGEIKTPVDTPSADEGHNVDDNRLSKHWEWGPPPPPSVDLRARGSRWRPKVPPNAFKGRAGRGQPPVAAKGWGPRPRHGGTSSLTSPAGGGITAKQLSTPPRRHHLQKRCVCWMEDMPPRTAK